MLSTSHPPHTKSMSPRGCEAAGMPRELLAPDYSPDAGAAPASRRRLESRFTPPDPARRRRSAGPPQDPRARAPYPARRRRSAALHKTSRARSSAGHPCAFAAAPRSGARRAIPDAARPSRRDVRTPALSRAGRAAAARSAPARESPPSRRTRTARSTPTSSLPRRLPRANGRFDSLPICTWHRHAQRDSLSWSTTGFRTHDDSS